MYLPDNPSIDTIRLGRLFDNMSESYKLFWFQAIVNKVNEGKFVLSFDELINEMIADAWYMVSEYRLNLGPSDKLEKTITKNGESISEQNIIYVDSFQMETSWEDIESVYEINHKIYVCPKGKNHLNAFNNDSFT